MNRRLFTVVALCGAGLVFGGCTSTRTASNTNQDGVYAPVPSKPMPRLNMAFASGDRAGMQILARQMGSQETMKFATVPVE